MVTKYTIGLTMEFDDKTKRDNIYGKLKQALASAKIADSWTAATLQSNEFTKPEVTSEQI
jgi:hypothetical protein